MTLKVLFISPVMPQESGNGLAMRAARTLGALARQFSTSLLVVPLYPTPGSNAIPESLAASLDAIATLDSSETTPMLEMPFINRSFDAVHVFRLSVLDAAEPYLHAPTRPLRFLDIDDIESVTHRRMARLARSNGDRQLANELGQLATRYMGIESDALDSFDVIYTCSSADAALLRDRGHAEIEILPNVVDLPPSLPPEPDSGPVRFLFAGTLGYYPNADGITWFVREVLPILRAEATEPFVVDVVGSGMTEELRQALDAPEINLVGWVTDIADAYTEAHAAIVPLRAGGGTRIKLLEGMAWGRPVVSTPIGAEGIDATPDVDILTAANPDAFAGKLLMLMSDPEKRRELGQAGRRFVTQFNRSARADDRIASAFEAARARRESRSAGGSPRTR